MATLTQAVATAGHNGDFTAIYYLPFPTYSGIRGVVASGVSIFNLGYLEISGSLAVPVVRTTGTGGNATAGTTGTLTGLTVNAADMTCYSMAYDVTNSGTAIADNPSGSGSTPWVNKNFGQADWQTSTTTASWSTSWTSRTYDYCAAAFESSGAWSTVQTGTNTANAQSLTLGAPTQNGNLLVIFVVSNNNVSSGFTLTTIDPPLGWATQRKSQYGQVH